MPNQIRLIPLFDIDWTLIKGGNKAHIEAFAYAFKKVFNLPQATLDEIDHLSKTDTLIIYEIARLHGVSDEEIAEHLDEAYQAITTYFFENANKNDYSPLPGVLELLEALETQNIPCGVLTGNIKPVALEKLRRAKLLDYFPFGAYGDEGYKRASLIPIATQAADAYLKKEIPDHHFVIIGDSPLDVECAREGGLPCIAVASGKVTAKRLEKLNPEMVVQSLKDKDRIISFIQNGFDAPQES